MDSFDSVERYLDTRARLAFGPWPTVVVELGPSKHRTADENLEIAERQARLGRDPWFLNQRQKRGLSRIVSAILSSARPDVEAIGAYIVDAMRSNLEEGRSRGGKKMRSIAAGYRAQKKEAGLASAVLQRTGQLFRSLRYRIKNG
jgi:hypothetical protein